MRSRHPLLSDPRFLSIRKALQSLDLAAEPPAEASVRAQAAVAIVLRQTPALEILLIRRAEAEGDPWSGHMALPGGRRDPADPDLLHTAIRETEEETAVSLDSVGSRLGRLGSLEPATRRLPPISIFPYVFAVPGNATAKAESREVDEVLWVPLKLLMDASASETVEIPLGDTVRIFPCFRLGERVVWGLTFRILTEFLETLRASLGSGGAHSLSALALPPTRR